MKQLDVFNQSYQSDNSSKKLVHWQLYVDGAARNNPGPAGAGIYILKDGQPIEKKGYFLGSKTNNEAEYWAIILGVLTVSELMSPDDTLEIFSDSQLLVKQILGQYKVRKPELQVLYEQVLRLLRPLRYQIKHVLREKNSVADKLANRGVDNKVPIPPHFKSKLSL